MDKQTQNHQTLGDFYNGDKTVGVNKTLFSKLVNADKMQRFARRNIFTSFTYRKSKKTVEAE